MPRPIRVEWHSRLEAIEALERPWRQLEQSVLARTPLVSCDYLIPWYRHHAARYGVPVVGAAWEDGALVGLAPLVARRGRVGRIPVTCVQFAAAGGEAGELLVADDRPEAAGVFLESLAESVPFDVACFNNLDPGSAPFRALSDAALRCRLGLELAPTAHARVDLSAGYEAYCRGMSRNFRRNVKRIRARIEAAGKVAVEGVHLETDPEALAGALERMFRVSDASWKATRNGPLGAHHRGFYREVAERFGRRGMVDLSILTIGRHDQAYMLGVAERGTYFDVTLSFHDSVRDLSPGAFLNQEVLRSLATRGIHTFVSHGVHDYKLRFATSIVPRSRAFVFARGSRAALSRALRFSLAPLWRRLGLLAPEGQARGEARTSLRAVPSREAQAPWR